MKAFLDEWRHITSGKFILLMLVIPLAIAAAFGYVFKNSTVQDAPLAVVDLDHSTYSGQLISKLEASQYVQVRDVFDNYIEPDMLLYNERYSGVLYLPPGLETSYVQGKAINLGLNLDMTMAVGAGTVRSGVSEVIGTENGLKGMSGILALEQRILYNPTSQTMMSTVIMFVNVIMLSILGLSTLSIVPRLRQEGTLHDELQKPLGLLCRALPYALVTAASFYLVLGVVKQLGSLRFEADWLQLLIPLILYGFSTSLMAMVIGWTASTPLMSAGRIVLIMLPSFLLSGAQVPYSLLPTPLQWINQILPLSLHFKFLRGLGYKGGQLGYFMPELGHYLLIIGLFSACILLLVIKESISLKKNQSSDSSVNELSDESALA